MSLGSEIDLVEEILMNLAKKFLVPGSFDLGPPQTTAQINFSEIAAAICCREKIDMGVGKFAAGHDRGTDFVLLWAKLDHTWFTTAMEIIAKIIRVSAKVTLLIGAEGNNPNVRGVREKRLQDKGKGKNAKTGLVEDIFH